MENNQEDEEKSKEADDNYKDGGLKRGGFVGFFQVQRVEQSSLASNSRLL